MLYGQVFNQNSVTSFSHLKEIFFLFWNRRKDWLKLSFFPFCLFFLSFLINQYVSFLGNHLQDSSSFLLFVAFRCFSFFLIILSMTFLFMDGFRYALLGELETDEWIHIVWNRRHWRFTSYGFIYSSFLVVGLSCYIAGFTFFGLNFNPGGTIYSFLHLLAEKNSSFPRFYFLIVYVVLGLTVISYLAMRLALFMPSVALDAKNPLSLAWKGTKKHSVSLFCLFVLLGFSMWSLNYAIKFLMPLWQGLPFEGKFIAPLKEMIGLWTSGFLFSFFTTFILSLFLCFVSYFYKILVLPYILFIKVK